MQISLQNTTFEKNIWSQLWSCVWKAPTLVSFKEIIDKTLMTLFYHAFIEAILFSSLLVLKYIFKEQKLFGQIVKLSRRLIEAPQLYPASLYIRQLQWMNRSIFNDDSHPLYNKFQLFPSGLSFKVPHCTMQWWWRGSNVHLNVYLFAFVYLFYSFIYSSFVCVVCKKFLKNTFTANQMVQLTWYLSNTMLIANDAEKTQDLSHLLHLHCWSCQ